MQHDDENEDSIPQAVLSLLEDAGAELSLVTDAVRTLALSAQFLPSVLPPSDEVSH